MAGQFCFARSMNREDGDGERRLNRIQRTVRFPEEWFLKLFVKTCFTRIAKAVVSCESNSSQVDNRVPLHAFRTNGVLVIDAHDPYPFKCTTA